MSQLLALLPLEGGARAIALPFNVAAFVPLFLTFGAAGLSYKERLGPCGENNKTCLGKAADTWMDIRADTEQAYDRSSDCKFTSFHGYEWTAGLQTGQNLHHNVL